MTNAEIYKQTQLLAQRLALTSGHIALDIEMFRRNSLHPKARDFFELAVVAQEFLKGHEMEDAISEVEDLPW